MRFALQNAAALDVRKLQAGGLLRPTGAGKVASTVCVLRNPLRGLRSKSQRTRQRRVRQVVLINAQTVTRSVGARGVRKLRAGGPLRGLAKQFAHRGWGLSHSPQANALRFALQNAAADAVRKLRAVCCVLRAQARSPVQFAYYAPPCAVCVANRNALAKGECDKWSS